MLALSRLMPNIGGPKEARRKLLAAFVQSVILYGAPVWGPSFEYSKQRTDQLLLVKRRSVLCCICAYQTRSQIAANIIASMPAIDLLVTERSEIYRHRRNTAFPDNGTAMETPAWRRITIQRWVRQLDSAEKGEWTSGPRREPLSET
ncbi:uncharacterized protein LOC111037891 [Myzus persicae]|uniref:uncharacterized protein LOC111037891 n=1 Tax=Myzus persicae TaxID=13164 RepID=UPI000B9367DF|nr:uncharacterized protein LOC111037891 [Myzus persicae]